MTNRILLPPWLQERAADCSGSELAALARQAVALLRCVGECLQLVQAMHKCLEEVKEVRWWAGSGSVQKAHD